MFEILAWTSVTTGRHKEGNAAAEAGLELARKAGDLQSIMTLQAVLALSCLFLGEFDTAQQSIHEAVSTARQHGFDMELAMLLTIYAQTTYFSGGDRIQAKAYLDEAAVLAQKTDYRWANSMSAFGMGHVRGPNGRPGTRAYKIDGKR